MKLLFRIPEAAEALGRSRSRIYELVEAGELELVKDGRSALITATSLQSFLETLRERKIASLSPPASGAPVDELDGPDRASGPRTIPDARAPHLPTRGRKIIHRRPSQFSK